MGILRKSTPHRSESKIIPDDADGMKPFIQEPYTDDDFEPEEGSSSGHHTGSGAQGDEQEGQLAVDVFQTADEIVVVAPIAGVTIDDLSITITDEILTIKGRRRFSFKVDSTDYLTKECFWGDFSRAVILPESVDNSQVKASFKKGILTLRIPKIEKIHTRMVKIREE